MEVISLKDISIESIALTSHVKTIKFVSNKLFYGIGNKIHCYDWKRKLHLETIDVFNSTHSVHGIRVVSCTNDELELLFFGGKSVRVYTFSEGETLRLKPLTNEQFISDWIHDAVSIPSSAEVIVAFLTAHNNVILWNWRDGKVLREYQGSEKCILYSGHVLCSNSGCIVLAVGTVFSEIITWFIDLENNNDEGTITTLHRLTGHQGVVFSIKFNACLNLLCSTSDDRTVRTWKFVPNTSLCKPCKNQNPVLNTWLQGSFESVHVYFGHEARVWSSVILKECIISVGEDSTLCFWNHDGSLLRREKCHNGGSIWCIDTCNKNTLVATGGSDSGVLLWDVNQITQSSIPTLLSLQSQTNDFPRSVHLITKVNKQFLLITTDKGKILTYDFQKEAWFQEHTEEVFSSYAYLSISPDEEIVLVGTLHGEILCYTFGEAGLTYSSRAVCTEGKVNGIHWLNEKSQLVLVCGINGEMNLLEVNVDAKGICLSLKNSLHLPKSNRHWWSTAAVFIEKFHLLLVGDRTGSVHVFTDMLLDSSNSKIHPVASYFSIHGRNGVTDIREKNNLIYSSGRDGKLIVYEASVNGAQKLHTVKVPNNIEWIGRILFWNDDFVLLGFHANDFICWSMTQQRCHMEVTCGGGHRSWDLSIGSDLSAVFVAIKKKELVIVKRRLSSLSNELSPSCGIFGMPVRCMCFISSITDRTNGNASIIACGGEDPTLKIIGLNTQSSKQPSFFILHCISSHLSNIRAIAKCKMHEDTHLMISAGGRAQICAWKVISKKRDVSCELLATDFLWNVDKPTNKPWKEKHKQIPDPQTRYMDVAVWKHDGDKYFIGTACSDSFVRIHALDVKGKVFSIVDLVKHGEHCVLKTSLLSCGSLFGCLLATAATDGFLKIFEGSVVEKSSEKRLESPIFHKRLLQSGINALDFKQLEGQEWVICMGGDDNSISILIVRAEIHGNKTSIITISSGSEKGAHSSQISGIKFLSRYCFVSVSIDQRLNLWHCKQTNKNINLNLIWTKISYIADISYLEVWQDRITGLWIIAVCGEGVETFVIPSSKIDHM